MKTSNLELKRICARAIFHLAEEEISRTTVRVQGGLGYLMELVKDKNNFHNLPLMAAGKQAKKHVSKISKTINRVSDFLSK